MLAFCFKPETGNPTTFPQISAN